MMWVPYGNNYFTQMDDGAGEPYCHEWHATREEIRAVDLIAEINGVERLMQNIEDYNAAQRIRVNYSNDPWRWWSDKRKTGYGRFKVGWEE